MLINISTAFHYIQDGYFLITHLLQLIGEDFFYNENDTKIVTS